MTVSATPVSAPGPDEYAPNFAGYVGHVPVGVNILDLLVKQADETQVRLRGIPESRGRHRYAPGKWSVKEVVLHLADTERIMTYRALRIARADTTPLPGFDENLYTPESGADAVPLGDLAAEFRHVRQASLDLFRHLPAEAWTRRGIATNATISVRALAWIVAGHERHHLGVLAERYGV